MADQSRPEQRIAKLLARAGIASRREVERMIADGRVALNGTTLDTPATLVRSLHGVTVDGAPVAAPPPAQLFLFHKPNGLLVTERDPAGRPTIYDRLPRDLPRLVPVGRLDLNTEGLLLLTTDGGLKRQLELPATGVERAYRARTYGEISQAQLEELIEGVEIDGIRYGSIDANLERRTGANTWIELILTEGKNREVRRVLEHLGLQVSRLIRTRYGPFLLGDLQPGEIGEVRQHDLVEFRRTLERKQRPTEAVIVAPRAPSSATVSPAGGDAPGSDRETPQARRVNGSGRSDVNPRGSPTRGIAQERPARPGRRSDAAPERTARAATPAEPDARRGRSFASRSGRGSPPAERSGHDAPRSARGEPVRERGARSAPRPPREEPGGERGRRSGPRPARDELGGERGRRSGPRPTRDGPAAERNRRSGPAPARDGPRRPSTPKPPRGPRRPGKR